MLTFCFQYPKYGLADHADAMLGALQWEVNGRRIAGPAIERNREKWPRYRGVTRRLSRCVVVALLQLRVLRLGLLQDGDVGVGVFPEREKTLIGGTRLCGISLHGICPGEAELGERRQREIQHDTAMIEKLLELSGCRCAVVRRQLSHASQV